jgi:hypothetical protein
LLSRFTDDALLLLLPLARVLLLLLEETLKNRIEKRRPTFPVEKLFAAFQHPHTRDIFFSLSACIAPMMIPEI